MEENHDVEDLNDVLVLQQGRFFNAIAVHKGAVKTAKIFDEVGSIGASDARMATGNRMQRKNPFARRSASDENLIASEFVVLSGFGSRDDFE